MLEEVLEGPLRALAGAPLQKFSVPSSSQIEWRLFDAVLVCVEPTKKQRLIYGTVTTWSLRWLGFNFVLTPPSGFGWLDGDTNFLS